MENVNKIFESIHEVYESNKGGGIWLDDNKKLIIKNQLRQLILANKNHGVIGDVSESVLCEDCFKPVDKGDNWCKHCGEVIV